MSAWGEIAKSRWVWKSAVAIVSSAERAQVVHELRRDYPIDGLLKQAALPRSTFYYQQRRMQAADKHRQLKVKISEIYHRHKGRYGYRRVTAALRHLS
jgi:putative transposase